MTESLSDKIVRLVVPLLERTAVSPYLFPSLAALLAALSCWLIHQHHAANRKDAAGTQPTQKEVVWLSHFGVKVLQFVYDKHLNRFNTRREHEWRVYFSAWALLGAMDWALMNRDVALQGWTQKTWPFLCAAIFVTVFGYESEVQMRNRGNVELMEDIEDSLLHVAEHPAPDRCVQPLYGWAFWWQMSLIALGVIASALLPWIGVVPASKCP